MGKGVDAGARRQFESRTRIIVARAINWCIWKALLPGMLLALLWPIYSFVLKLPHPFQRAFANGDLLIFAALIMVEASLEGEHIENQSGTFRFLTNLARLFAVLLIFAFAFVKYDVILQEAALARAAAADQGLILDKLRAYSCFSCSVASVSLVASLFTFAVVVDLERTEELRRLGLS